MKVIHFTHELPQASGVATFVRELNAALRAGGVESRIVLNPRELPREPEAGMVLHIHGMWKMVYHQAAQWAKKTGVPIVWSTHGMTAPWSMAHKRWKKLIAWWLYQKWDLKRAAVIHSTVEQEREWNAKLGLGVGGGCRSVVVPLGTHLPEAKEVEGGRLKVERRNDKVLLFVGRVYPVKALDRLIEAFQAVDNTGWKLRIVGPDQAGHMAELKAIAEQQVEFAGPRFRAELAAEYETCDCLALVSHTENFGATVVDAMAHGKPVMTSTATPWKEVEDEKCGWWVDNDVETLSKAIREMMVLSDEERVEMGAHGRKLVEAKYTWEAVARKMNETYGRII